MHDRDTLSVPYGSVGHDGSTVPLFLHAGNMQNVRIEPPYERMVDHTHSEWNIWGNSNTFHSDNTYTSPFLPDPVNSMHMSQVATTSLNHVPYTTVNNSHCLTPLAISYPSTAQDVLDPDGSASFAPYCDGGRVPQSSQQPPVYWPHTSSDGGGNQAPSSAFSAWNQDSGEEMEGLVFTNA
ncbi:hypothetical protein PM082_001814 [Marasmius tenuissimus]|nr:hypothetical protein PM082_001814 [Marasmius tenuissimus]